MKMDYQILIELLDVVEELGQRTGRKPGEGHPSSRGELEKDVSRFRETCEKGSLSGKRRKRRSGQLFRRIISLYPDIWKS